MGIATAATPATARPAVTKTMIYGFLQIIGQSVGVWGMFAARSSRSLGRQPDLSSDVWKYERVTGNPRPDHGPEPGSNAAPTDDPPG